MEYIIPKLVRIKRCTFLFELFNLPFDMLIDFKFSIENIHLLDDHPSGVPIPPFPLRID